MPPIHRFTRTAMVTAVAAAAAAASTAVAITVAATPSSAATCTGYVGLTFDDGPTPGNTPNLLNALRSAGLRATFFNEGQNVQPNPSLVQAQVAGGHWIGNHSWSHPHLTQLSQSQMDSEISRTQQAIPQIATNLASRNLCAGMISPATGRAVAPDGATPTPTSTSPTPTTSASPTRPPSPSPSSPSPGPTAGSGCRVTSAVNAWNTGLTNTVTITNTGGTAVNGWRLTFTLPGGQAIVSGWNATYSPTSGQVTATNASYNATIAPSASTSIGYQATHTGNSAAPDGYALNGVACAS